MNKKLDAMRERYSEVFKAAFTEEEVKNILSDYINCETEEDYRKFYSTLYELIQYAEMIYILEKEFK